MLTDTLLIEVAIIDRHRHTLFEISTVGRKAKIITEATIHNPT